MMTAPSAQRIFNRASAVGVGLIISSSPWPASPADTAAARRHYRFRPEQVYRHAGPSIPGKLRRAPLGCCDRTCGAIARLRTTPRVQRTISPVHNKRGADQTQCPATNLRTTLVLIPERSGFLDRRKQFCSDRCNEISAAPRSAIFGLPGGEEKKQQTEISIGRLAHQGGTPCHGRICLDDNS